MYPATAVARVIDAQVIAVYTAMRTAMLVP
jgi:hypothetical protein